MLELPDHPWFPNDVMVEDPALLEQLVDAETGPVERTLFGRIPLRLLGATLVSDTARLSFRVGCG
jgi:hypothetical protein